MITVGGLDLVTLLRPAYPLLAGEPGAANEPVAADEAGDAGLAKGAGE
jgi:hypothetical protein